MSRWTHAQRRQLLGPYRGAEHIYAIMEALAETRDDLANKVLRARQEDFNGTRGRWEGLNIALGILDGLLREEDGQT